VLTEFTGNIQAIGGIGYGGNGGPGTVYLKTVTPVSETVLINNEMSATAAPVQVPQLFAPEDEVANASFVLDNSVTLQLIGDYSIGDLWLSSPLSIVDLNGNTLRINSFEHDLLPGSVTGEGKIIWRRPSQGTVIKLR
ncbi:MAG: hypothetical protein GX811_02550, partial [Lentisphaerae bacterium]|nr:hypothetical protein [Lentisphaerota bacterium]